MKVRGLQQQLAVSNYLLPSQRDLLSRLLFQLAFNDFTKLAIFGAKGSGKSTLALALAELFSECQEMTVNVALLQAPMSTEQLIAQLAKQWFAAPQLSATELAASLAAGAANTEWVLIVDDPEQLTQQQTDWLSNLAVRLFIFAGTAQEEMQLNLAIPQLTLADCEQLLQAEALDTLSLAERFAHSQGNLHKLLTKERAVSKPRQTHTPDKKPLLAAAIGGLLVVLVTIALWLNHDAAPTLKQQGTASAGHDSAQLNAIALPNFVDSSEDESAPSIKPEINAADILPDSITLLAKETPAVAADATTQAVSDAIPASTETASAHSSKPAELLSAAESEANAEVVLTTTPESNAQVALQQEPKTDTQLVLPLAAYDHSLLLDASPKALVVQLAVLSGENALKRFRQSHPQLQVLVYQRSWQGKEQWIIVSGPFSSNATAKQHIQQLPGSLSSSGPFIKTVGAVQQEILAWQRLKLAKTNQGN
ncbi:hypothetical protein GCM10010919_07230 [Alishewanella longhuensis]|uniref:SPOR domain-containing protein n=1 Tax=Alishewanella longhuensis TaxID=1091037 RepID=A0ABQ3KUK7_9ALTE|nr:AAA family ATPase [Alishewanella longhuensis]GHG62158.1 hypothetical protein GCM10010919_07230 [Alishewanella longhuensis]